MKRITFTVSGYQCERCDHKWAPRNDDKPRVCPSCKSPYWDKKRTLIKGMIMVKVKKRKK